MTLKNNEKSVLVYEDSQENCGCACNAIRTEYHGKGRKIKQIIIIILFYHILWCKNVLYFTVLLL